MSISYTPLELLTQKKGVMMKKIFFLLAALVLLPVNRLYAFNNGDFQMWHTEAQQLKLSEPFKITTEEEFRWGNNVSLLYYQHYDAGLVYNANKNMDLSVNYRQIFEKRSGKGKFKDENRLHVNLTFKTDIYGFKLEDRNRIEYRHFRDKADFTDYRNKLSLSYPLTVSNVEFYPYVANEIFVDLKDKGGFTRNRLYSGLGVNLTKYIKAEIYYMLQSTKSSGSWIDANVLGTKIKIAF